MSFIKKVNRFGFDMKMLRLIHPHPFLPYVEQVITVIFIRYSLAMEALMNTPLVASTSSSFIVGLLKKED